MNFYLSVFKNGKVIHVSENGDAVHSVQFELEGQTFIGFNAGPGFPFTEAISFFVDCETQEEVDTLWAKLTVGGSESQCGWLKDKFGLSWQIVSSVLGKLLGDPDPAKAGRAMQAMLQMQKIDIAALQRAYDGS